jgi:hypothetical protein
MMRLACVKSLNQSRVENISVTVQKNSYEIDPFHSSGFWCSSKILDEKKNVFFSVRLVFASVR